MATRYPSKMEAIDEMSTSILDGTNSKGTRSEYMHRVYTNEADVARVHKFSECLGNV